MPGTFVGTIELTDVGDIKIAGADIQSVFVGGTQVFPTGGGGLPILFSWNPEAGEALPGTSTFERASPGYYRNDSGLWVQAAANEVRLHNQTNGGGEKGYLAEPGSTNLALHRRDFTNAVWVATNITPAKDATGIDGVASAASTLTATAANGTILQSITNGSSAHTYSVFVARKTGTGTIEITIDGGSTWVDITSSISSDIRDNPYKVTQTLANPSIGFRIGTSGDEIEVDIAQLEASSSNTTPIDDAASPGATASRSRDGLTDSTVYPTTGYTAFGDATGPEAGGGMIYSASGGFIVNGAAGDSTISANFSANFFQIGGSSVTDTRLKISVSDPNDGASSPVYLSATGETTAVSSSTTQQTGATLAIGSFGASLPWRGVIHNVILYDTAVSQSENESLVNT